MNKQNAAGVIAMLVLVTVGMTVAAILAAQQSYGTIIGSGKKRMANEAAPIAISGDNTYIAWWTNKTGNDEVVFRASADNGATFADKINLSNSTGAESQDVEIAAGGDNVIVSWWERNATSNEPVVRISTDNGATFGPVLQLAINGTIG